MNFDLSEDEEMVKALAERFVFDHYDVERRRQYLAEPQGFSTRNWELLGELGLIAALFDAESGGLDLDATGLATIFEALGRGMAVEPLIERALAETGMAGFRDRELPTMSGGEQQRAHFARVLVQLACGEAEQGPGVLLLDEPTSSLDMRHQLELIDSAKARAKAGTAVVAVLHDLNLAARFADRVIVLQRGHIVADGPVREMITADLLARVFEVDVRLDTAGEGLPAILPQAMQVLR